MVSVNWKRVYSKDAGIIAMKEKYIQILGIALTAVYGGLVVFLYAAEPRSLEELTAKAVETVQNAVTKGQVVAGTYEIDKAKFAEGLAAFRQDNYPLARDAFAKADPERRDPTTQFYIAYSFYRQGWGRVTNDDVMFRQALEAVERVTFLDRDFAALIRTCNCLSQRSSRTNWKRVCGSPLTTLILLRY